jgi:hypothetical protein
MTNNRGVRDLSANNHMVLASVECRTNHEILLSALQEV